MALQVVGAGVGRTGTHSLKIAVEQLTGGPCYHMTEVFGKPDHVDTWRSAAEGSMPDWDDFLAGYRGTLDWPACTFWRELAAAYPDAPVLLSTRPSTDAWYGSMERTIIATVSLPPKDAEHAHNRSMTMAVLRAFTPDWPDPDAIRAAYERHNEAVRREIPADRLIDWQTGDGWEPICRVLGVPVPDEPFPHVNTADEFRANLELDADAAPGAG
jgi:hypothetical protein